MRFVLLILGMLLNAGLEARNAVAETRVALVVGNSAYQSTPPLANPLHDARDMAAGLKAAGFSVIEAVDTDKRRLDGALRAFTDVLAKADVALFFYAGHGLQVGQHNYLVPIDAKLERERDLEFEAVRLDFVLRQMEIDREGKTSIVILDACRDNPLSRNLARTMGTRSAAIGRGLAAAATGLGTFIAYSTQPGNVALDGEGRNSPFTTALVRHMPVPGRSLNATMIEVRKDVVAATGGKQVPWDHSALTGDFQFVPARSERPQGSVAAAPAGSEADIAALQERLRRLEEETRQRTQNVSPQVSPQASAPPLPPAGSPKVPPVTAKPRLPKDRSNYSLDENVRLDGLKLSEQRQPSPAACRESCESEPSCVAFQHGKKVPVMGQCHLFGRVDARHEDQSWRSGLRAADDATPKGPVVAIRSPVTRREQGFDVHEGVAAIGDPIKMGTADSVGGCQTVCRNTPGCVAATYNAFFRGKNVACQVYSRVTDTIATPTSTTSVRSDR